MENVYYNPERFDLTLIGEIEPPDLSYEFAIMAFWKHKDGKVYAGYDSGCSCPSPFEETAFEYLEVVSSLEAAKRMIDGYDSSYLPYRFEDKAELLKEIAEALA